MPALVCGFGASVVTTVPGIKNFGCCLIIPVAVYLALFLDRKINFNLEFIRPAKAISFGLLTGIFAALFSTFFEILITYVARTNDFITTLPELDGMFKAYLSNPAFAETMQLLKSMEKEIQQTGFSTLYLVFFFLNSIIVNIVFGIVGGLFGMHFINKKSNIQQ